MANQHLNTNNIKTIFDTYVIAQVEQFSFFKKLVGEKADQNAFVYHPSDAFRTGKTWRVPLRKALSGSVIEDGGTYEGQGEKMVYSNTDLTANERGFVVGEFSDFETMQSDIDMLGEAKQALGERHIADHDEKVFSGLTLAHATLPSLSERDTSQYNVHFVTGAEDWGSIAVAHKLTRNEVVKAKMYFETVRGIRPGTWGSFTGHILLLPSGACFDLFEEDPKIREELLHALPADERHVLFTGRGWNPVGMIDGTMIVKDARPVYGGSDYTYLITQDMTAYQKFEGVFMGAQGVAYAEWLPMTTWFERKYDHGRKTEISVRNIIDAEKAVVNLGTLNSASNRDYGVGYVCGACTRPW